jgi:hypothetical protein
MGAEFYRSGVLACVSHVADGAIQVSVGDQLIRRRKRAEAFLSTETGTPLSVTVDPAN